VWLHKRTSTVIQNTLCTFCCSQGTPTYCNPYHTNQDCLHFHALVLFIWVRFILHRVLRKSNCKCHIVIWCGAAIYYAKALELIWTIGKLKCLNLIIFDTSTNTFLIFKQCQCVWTQCLSWNSWHTAAFLSMITLSSHINQLPQNCYCATASSGNICFKVCKLQLKRWSPFQKVSKMLHRGKRSQELT
jgi:hypothetical protein